MEDLQERIEQLHGAQADDSPTEPVPSDEISEQKKKP